MPDAIVLVGLSGSGKTTVAALLAQRLGRPLVDLDARIEERHGATPAVLIRTRGEDRFRELEAEAVREAVGIAGSVIATGGGAVIDPLNRWALWDAGTIVWLDAPDEVLLARLAADDVERALLAGDAPRALAGLRSARTPFYRAADVRVDTSGPLERVADAVIEAGAGRRTGILFDAVVRRDHPMGPPNARVVLGRDLDPDALTSIVEPASTGIPVIVADARAAAALPDLVSALPPERLLVVRSGERQKRLRSVEGLLEAAARMGAERGDAWIGLGGGTTTDLVGTAAALYLRGAPFVGGKVAVDLSAAKNAAGAFWPPVAIVADIASLRPLPRARRLDGMAESLKSGLIGDPALWALVESRGRAALGRDEAARYAILDRSVRLKLGVVDRDPFEAGERRTLNLGHTLGHALEVESRYRLPHGQAVVLGLRAVAAIAAGRGAEPDLAARIDAVVADLGFSLQRSFDAGVVRAALGSDKKRLRGRQRWILPMEVGRVVEVDDVTDAELEVALRTISVPSAAHVRSERRRRAAA
jgi:shikimate kinase / 3-dehydroquinate synthase